MYSCDFKHKLFKNYYKIKIILHHLFMFIKIENLFKINDEIFSHYNKMRINIII
jgi:hypothetical protein